MAWLLIIVGAVLVVFAVLSAFTIYGELTALVGVVAIASGTWKLSRHPSPPG